MIPKREAGECVLVQRVLDQGLKVSHGPDNVGTADLLQPIGEIGKEGRRKRIGHGHGPAKGVLRAIPTPVPSLRLPWRA